MSSREKRYDLDSHVAGNNGPLYPKVDHFWLKVAHNYEPLALLGVFIHYMALARTPGWESEICRNMSLTCDAWGSLASEVATELEVL